ncbi:MAG: hypothetical protein JWO60_546, partial [Frankiales bacterium]|nr:hypothetical protein [Frankiales bacterium]
PLEWLGWLVLGAVTAVLTTWPLATRLRTTVPQDLGDPLGQAWFLAWGGHALRTQPGDLFRGNTFWPSPTSYAHSDSLFGWAPFALFGEGPQDAVVRYGLVFMVSFALALCAAALLARELGCGLPAAAVTGVAYAYAPWKMTHLGHLNVLSTAGVALALFLLLSGYRRDRPWQVVAGWAAAAWQMTMGFALGIWFAYFLLALGLLALSTWLGQGRPALPRRLLVATGAGGALLLAVTGFMVRPYLAIVSADPGSLRGRADVELYSPPARGLLAASRQSRAWADATEFVWSSLPAPVEQALFPGLLAVLLALLGLRWRGATRGLRIGLGVGTVLVVLLSLGLDLWGGLLYAPLFDHLPGFEGLRTTGRLAFLWSLGLALLAGFGAQRAGEAVVPLLRERLEPQAVRPAAVGLVLVLALVVCYEGAPRVPLADVPPAPTAMATAPGPQFHLPSDALQDTAYMLWSTAGWPQIGNGGASYTPDRLDQARQEALGFPDAGSVQRMRQLGFRTVLVHRARTPGTPWDGAADKPVEGLGVTRTDVGDVVVFDLVPTG